MSESQGSGKQPIPDYLVEYRKFLVTAEQKAQEDFDKAVLTLSGGALGISFTFLKEVVGSGPVAYPGLLLCAWACWAASILCVLFSYHLSHLSLRLAISQVDDGTIYKQKAGGKFATWTARLNIAGAALFVVGVLSITSFAGTNFYFKEGTHEQKRSIDTTPNAAAPATGPAPAASTASAPRRPGN